MARPLRIEFTWAVYHGTSQLSYLGTRLIRERLVTREIKGTFFVSINSDACPVCCLNHR